MADIEEQINDVYYVTTAGASGTGKSTLIDEFVKHYGSRKVTGAARQVLASFPDPAQTMLKTPGRRAYFKAQQMILEKQDSLEEDALRSVLLERLQRPAGSEEWQAWLRKSQSSVASDRCLDQLAYTGHFVPERMWELANRAEARSILARLCRPRTYVFYVPIVEEIVEAARKERADTNISVFLTPETVAGVDSIIKGLLSAISVLGQQNIFTLTSKTTAERLLEMRAIMARYGLNPHFDSDLS